jgi:hypothetical protein
VPAAGVPVRDERHGALLVDLEADVLRVPRDDLGGVRHLRERKRAHCDGGKQSKTNEETDVPGRSHLELMSAGAVMDFNP